MVDEQALKVESLADRLARAGRDNAPQPQNSRLDLLKRLIPGRKRLADRLTPPLPSGLLVEEAEELSQAISTALRRLHRAGQTIQSEVRPTDITLRELGPVWDASFAPEVVQAGKADAAQEQPTLARLFYTLLLGNSARLNDTGDLTWLRTTFPETVRVLAQALHGEFASSGEMAGAFGWSLYRRDQILHTPPEPPLPKSTPKPAAGPVEIVEETQSRPASGGLTGLTAWLSLGLAMILLIVFIVYSVITASQPVASQQAIITPTTTLAPTIAPTIPPALQTSRQNDGSYQTRYQAAWAEQSQAGKWIAPSDLAPGNVTPLTGGRPMQVADVGFPPGQTLYLSLADGGWEVWDSVSKSRISRRELPNADQYWRVSLSPDGENFAAITFDGQLRLGTEGRVLRTTSYIGNSASFNGGFSWQNYGPEPFYWSPNSNYLLLNSPSGVHIWNFASGLREIELQDKNTYFGGNNYISNQNAIAGIVWSGDSRYLAVFSGREDKIYIYETQNMGLIGFINTSQTKQPIYTSNTGDNLAYLAWSPDGTRMALLRWVSNTDGSFNSTEAELANWKMPSLNASVPLTPTNIQTINLKEIDSNSWPASAWLNWSNNNRLLLGYHHTDSAGPTKDNWRIQIYNSDYANNNLQAGPNLDLPTTSTPMLIRWSPDSERILFNERTGRLLYYNARSDQSNITEGPILNQGQQRTDWITGWATAPDGKTIATIYNNNRLEITDAQTGQTTHKLDYPDLTVNGTGYSTGLKWSPDGHYLAVGYLVLTQNASRTQILINSQGSNERKFEPIIRVWQLDRDEPHLNGDYLLPNDYFNTQFEWDSTSSTPGLFFEIGDNRIGEWDLTKPVPSLADQRKLNWVISVNGANPPTDPTTGTLPFRVVGQLNINKGAGDRQNAEMLWPTNWRTFAIGQARGQQDAFSIFQVYSGTTQPGTKPILLDPNPSNNNQYISNDAKAISPDGRLVAIGLSNGLINVYETNSGKLVQSWQAHQGLIGLVRWSLDGKSLATGASDRAVKVWNTTTWRLTDILRGNYDTPDRLEWLPDNKTLFVATGSNSVTALLWKIKS